MKTPRARTLTFWFTLASFFGALPAFADLGPNQQKIIDLVYSVADFMGGLFLAVSVCMFLYTGYLYFTAQGDPGKITKVNQALLWAVVGTGIGLLAFVMPQVINTFLSNATQ
ncbi:MAG: hypothetical protein KGI50_03785 [Patescibacteria group bacterium]|nr:hypothetical protein [Patescibacteria group bacterium]MDE2438410.1 hypothetical protein [Patescibacteria group bacterium]